MRKQQNEASILADSRTRHVALRRLVSVVRLVLMLIATTVPALAQPVQADPLHEALRERVEMLRRGREIPIAGGVVSIGERVTTAYERRDFQLAWTSPARRQALIRIVAHSDSHGLEPADYQPDALRRATALPDDSAAAAADRDLLFTDALVRLATHLRDGKVAPTALDPDWGFPSHAGGQDTGALDALIDAPDLDRALEQWPPALDAYAGLRAALARYRRIAAEGGWPSLPDGPTLRPETPDARLPILRRRLQITDDAPPAADPDNDRFDDALSAAIVRFQRRHGLEPDGLVGRRTRAALNVDVQRRIDQIRVNLERLRWLSPELVGDHLRVDVAAFEASLQVDGRTVWSSRAVVGRTERATPSFRATMRYLVLNPEWVVPPTILRDDLLPRIIAHPAYLAEHDLRVEDFAGDDVDPQSIDWSLYRHNGFPFQIVQRPGPDNPVGHIKFVLPNPYSVYLHDTPSKALFDKPERLFSSGCIRLQRPLELAVQLLDEPALWSLESLRTAITSGETRTVPVRRHVPVLVVYLTATASADGAVHFRRDVYARDPAVLAALRRPVGQSRALPAR